MFPNCQIFNVGDSGDRDGVQTAPMEIHPLTGEPATVGNDEFEIRFQ